MESLLKVPFEPGMPWDDRHDEGQTAFFVPIGLWVRADNNVEAQDIAQALIGVQEDVDTGEAGHVKSGWLIKEVYVRA